MPIVKENYSLSPSPTRSDALQSFRQNPVRELTYPARVYFQHGGDDYSNSADEFNEIAASPTVSRGEEVYGGFRTDLGDGSDWPTTLGRIRVPDGYFNRPSTLRLEVHGSVESNTNLSTLTFRAYQLQEVGGVFALSVTTDTGVAADDLIGPFQLLFTTTLSQNAISGQLSMSSQLWLRYTNANSIEGVGHTNIISLGGVYDPQDAVNFFTSYSMEWSSASTDNTVFLQSATLDVH